MGHRLVHI